MFTPTITKLLPFVEVHLDDTETLTPPSISLLPRMLPSIGTAKWNRRNVTEVCQPQSLMSQIEKGRSKHLHFLSFSAEEQSRAV